MKFLFTTTVGLTTIFLKDLTKDLIQKGHTLDIACNEDVYKVEDIYRELGCNIYQINWSRSPFSFKNIQALKELRTIIEKNNYDIVHCHTPIAGVCTRLVCNPYRKKGLKVVYTAHGFHFYKGAPLKNWIIYYPIEKVCSYLTDVLITITKEDYELANKKMKAKKIEYIPGVGVEITKFKNVIVNKEKKRQDLKIPKEAFLILSVGELNKNKNHKAVIQAISTLNNSKIHYMIAGKGNLNNYLQQLTSELNIETQVHFLGYRKDVDELYKISNLYILSSYREGLNVSIIEAMASGVQVVCSKIRGNIDVVEKKYCFNPYKIEEIASLINKFANNECSNDTQKSYDSVEKYDVYNILNKVTKIYKKL